MPTLGPLTGQKRKMPLESTGVSNAKKRQKSRDSRGIQTQNAQDGMSSTGELNIASYVKAREFEIQALDSNLQKARKGLMSRAFQQVPRHMRRRTASHNVKKVPRRLRRKAEREMKEDNTPTVTKKSRTPSRALRLKLETAKAMKAVNEKTKTIRQKRREAKAKANQQSLQSIIPTPIIPRIKKNKLADPPAATSKYKRRQVHKTWLPTHLWHTKRAHMTRPLEPLWRMAIPLSPTEKSYRPTHRAAGSRGCVAWDKSYMSTVGCFGTETALESMLRSLKFIGEEWTGKSYQRWKDGTRFAQGLLHERDRQDRIIGPATVMWCPATSESKEAKVAEKNTEDIPPENEDMLMQDGLANPPKNRTRLDRRLFIRIHPSAFYEFWLELLKVAKMQKPQVLVEDLRFEIGSIEVTGPGSTEALIGVLRPWSQSQVTEDSIADVWSSLAGINNPSLLPQNSMLSFVIQDPRLNHPPKQVKKSQDGSDVNVVNQTIISWPPDHNSRPSELFAHKSRWRANRSLPSSKAIDRRRALAAPGTEMIPTDKDPHIPILVLAVKSTSRQSNVQGTWMVLMPWHCIDAVWRSLMFYPFTSGGTPSFGGLKQEQQIALEQMNPWFPGDFPGTQAGKAWERTQSEERFDSWIQRPKSRRIAWDMVDLGLGRRGEIGRGWACDWDHLFAKEKELEGHKGEQNTAEIQVETRSQGEPSAPKPKLSTQRQRKAAKAQAEAEAFKQIRRRNTSSPESNSEEEDVKMVGNNSDLDPSIDFVQLSPRESSRCLNTSGRRGMADLPALITIRIKFLEHGTPSPAARVYRLPGRRAESTQSAGQKLTSDSAKPELSSETSASNQTSNVATLGSKTSATRDLLSEWLSLYSSFDTPEASIKNGKLKKDKTNHHGLKRKHVVYPRESLDHINVLPPNAPPEVIEMYGRKPKTEEQLIVENRHKLMAELMKGDVEEGQWDKFIPCPDEEDLIGFVTSGSYNLAEGRGTAIGSLWLQKLLQRWQSEDQKCSVDEDKLDSAGKTFHERQPEKIRHICIVRNAGESIGRLGTWEVCD